MERYAAPRPHFATSVDGIRPEKEGPFRANSSGLPSYYSQSFDKYKLDPSYLVSLTRTVVARVVDLGVAFRKTVHADFELERGMNSNQHFWHLKALTGSREKSPDRGPRPSELEGPVPCTVQVAGLSTGAWIIVAPFGLGIL